MKPRHLLFIGSPPPCIKTIDPYVITSITERKAIFDHLAQRTTDIVVLDVSHTQNFSLLEQINDQYVKLPIIILIEKEQLVDVFEAFSLGASDFLVKPFNKVQLHVKLLQIFQPVSVQPSIPEKLLSYEPLTFLSTSPKMNNVYQKITQIASSNANVFITGASGTGKELVAQTIHHTSPRRKHPFVVVNCSAIPKDLLESELFGHVKGAFTGTVKDRKGMAETANHGTLFLDEICEMPLELQAKLLRFTQTGQIQPVGSNTSIQLDIRFICATNRTPLDEINKGRFREDLYYRLHIIPIHLPSLHQRTQDILLLAHYFLTLLSRRENKNFLQFTPEAEHVLLTYPWHGNIRQLQNTIHAIVVLYDSEKVTHDMLKAILPEIDPSVHPLPVDQTIQQQQQETPTITPLWKIQQDAINQALSHTHHNVHHAASLLEISPSTVYRQLKKQRNKT